MINRYTQLFLIFENGTEKQEMRGKSVCIKHTRMKKKDEIQN